VTFVCSHAWTGLTCFRTIMTADVEESEELLKQFVQDALLLKSSNGGTRLYDQYVAV
jgi:hypothetical protein